MNVLAWILGVILIAGFGLAGITKVLDLDRVREHFGYSRRQYQTIGASELAGAVGIAVGLVWTTWEWVGLAAAVGLGSLMVGALITHARVEDEVKQIIPAMVMLVIASAFVIALSLR